MREGCVGGVLRTRQGSTYGLNSRGWDSELPHDMADTNKSGEAFCVHVNVSMCVWDHSCVGFDDREEERHAL